MQDQQGIVLSFGFVSMNESCAPSHRLHDPVVLTKEVAGCGNTVAAEIAQRATASLFDIPEMRAVRTAMRFAGAHPEDAADTTVLNRLTGFNDAGREHFRFGIAVDCAGSVRRGEYFARLFARAAEGFGADLIPLGLRQSQRRFEVLLVGEGNDKQVKVRACDDCRQICGVLRDFPAKTEGAGSFERAGVIDDYFLAIDISQALHIKIGHKTGAEHGNADGFIHKDDGDFFDRLRRSALTVPLRWCCRRTDGWGVRPVGVRAPEASRLLRSAACSRWLRP